MVARDVETAAAALRTLRREERERLGLAVLAFALALVATQVRPALALPLLAAGATAVVLEVQAAWRRWELLERLVLDRDAYAIPEVRMRGERAATMDSRTTLASSIRSVLREPGFAPTARVAACASDLEALASELDDDELVLHPVCAVTCVRLLTDDGESPLLNPELPPEDVRARVLRIRAGFERQGDST